MPLLRREIGDVLRSARQQQGRTLREVSGAARVSLGYLSEVERGQKEASSELLSSICDALEMPMSTVLRAVSDRVAAVEGAAPGLPVSPVAVGVVSPVSAVSPRGAVSARGAVSPVVAAVAASQVAPAALGGFEPVEPAAAPLPVGDLGIKPVVITRDGLVSAA